MDILIDQHQIRLHGQWGLYKRRFFSKLLGVRTNVCALKTFNHNKCSIVNIAIFYTVLFNLEIFFTH